MLVDVKGLLRQGRVWPCPAGKEAEGAASLEAEQLIGHITMQILFPLQPDLRKIVLPLQLSLQLAGF